MRTRTLGMLFVLALTVLNPLPSAAGQYGDALALCFADNTTGKERKELIRWLFAAIATHPDMRDMSNVTTKTIEQTAQPVGALLTRLLSENCSAQAQAAAQNEGSKAFVDAFGSLSNLAMQEIMSNNNVRTSLAVFEKYVDQKKIQSATMPR